jgi:hypothetical protein
MSISYRPLDAWNEFWALDGAQVRCKFCNAYQDLTENQAFRHLLSCEAKTLEDQYPARELAMVLQEKIRLGLF